MGFGKIFETMFEGSLVGSGPVVYSVWSYVIAKQRPSRMHGSVVRIQPTVLAATLGVVTPADVEKAIDFLCSADPKSSTKKLDGKRLVKVGEFDYRVVNGAKYRAMRQAEERKMQNREAQQRFRDKAKDPDGDGESEPMSQEEVAFYKETKGGADTPGGKVGFELK